jgi:hypothetical protein
MLTGIAIDPGASGAIVWITPGTFTPEILHMPETPKDILDTLADVYRRCPGATCYLERVGGYMPGNSGPAAVKFARHCGYLDMALLATGIPTQSVSPSVWMKAFGVPKFEGKPPEQKACRKRWIKAKVQQLYPTLHVTLETADAVAFLNTMLSNVIKET